MTNNPAFFVDLFAPWAPVSARRMFGGLGLYRCGVMFALVAEGTLYLKVDDLNHRDFAEACGRPFVYDGKGRPITMSYWTPPEDIFDDAEALKRWAQLAYDAALRAAGRRGRPTLE
jgi:DNA transformation protein